MIPRLLLLAALLAVFAMLVEWRLLGREPPPAGTQPARPGYYLEGVQLEEYGSDGRLRIGLKSANAVEDPASGIVTLSSVAVDYHAPTGRQWLLTARTGKVPPDSRVIEFEGEVTLTGPPEGGVSPAELRTSRLTLDTAAERAQTREAVELVFGPHRVQARGMMADLKGGNMRLESGVNGQFNP